MSPAHPNTVDVADDDDNDICPVCDGECTCHTPSLHHPSLNVQSRITSQIQKTPSLKIKLTLPPSMLGKRRASSSTKKSPKPAETTSVFESAGKHVPSTQQAHPISIPKRRGRPPKAVAAARKLAAQAAAEAHAAVTLTSQSSITPSQSPRSLKRKHPLKFTINHTPKKRHPKAASHAGPSSRLPAHLRNPKSIIKSCAQPTKRRRVLSSESSDVANNVNSSSEDDDVDNDDAQSSQFPTFVSASTLSSSDQDDNISDSSSSLSEFDTDLSVEEEEEKFIVAEENRAHDKARVRRELLGGDDIQKRREREHHRYDNWVIRPRKMSVGPSEGGMDVDRGEASSSGDDEGDEDEEEDADDADDDQTATGDTEGDGNETEPSSVYAGIATGWSDEESSFDADLFFTNLSSSSSGSESDSGSSTSGNTVADLAPSSDFDSFDTLSASLAEAAVASGLLPHLRSEPTSGRALQHQDPLPFEVVQGWDGQIVFTNGMEDGHGMMDLFDFEVGAAQVILESATNQPSIPVPADTAPDAMDTSTTDAEDTHTHTHPPIHTANSEDTGVDADAEEEDGADADVDEDDAMASGDSTDEDLVGADSLPNDRAMRLLAMPDSPGAALEAIDPMSTVSPVGSPGGQQRFFGRRLVGVGHRRVRSGSACESPRPADILAGRLFWDWEEVAEEDVEMHGDSDGPGGGRGSGNGNGDGEKGKRVCGPRRGVFEVRDAQGVASRTSVVIDDSHKGVPSPHPPKRVARGRARLRGLSRSVTGMLESTLRHNHRAFANRTSSMPASLRSPLDLDLQFLSPSELASASPSLPPTEPVNLDEVLNASFLDSDHSDSQSHIAAIASTTEPSTCSLASPIVLSTGPANNASNGNGTSGSAAKTDGESKQHLKSLSRWDLISVGAFRQRAGSRAGEDTRDHALSGVMRTNPLNTMLWNNAASSPHTPSPSSPSTKSSGKRSAGSSKTTGHKHGKSRKELRQERKLKRKASAGPVHHHAQHANHYGGGHNNYHHYHQHQHYPNMKSRSSSALQRTGAFFGSAGSSPM